MSATTPELDHQRLVAGVASNLEQQEEDVVPTTSATPLQPSVELRHVGADIIGLNHLSDTVQQLVNDVGHDLAELVRNKHMVRSDSAGGMYDLREERELKKAA